MLLAFTYWWITWNIPPLIPFSIINNKSKSVNCSYFTFKAAFHANCGTAKNQAGSSSYNSRNIFRKFSNKSASTSVLPLINKSWYSPNLSISKSCMQSASVLSSMFRKRSFNKFFPIIHIIVWLRPFRNSEICSLVVRLQNLYVLGNHFIKLYLVITLINKHLYTTKSFFYLFIQGNTHNFCNWLHNFRTFLLSIHYIIFTFNLYLRTPSVRLLTSFDNELPINLALSINFNL